MNTPFKRTKIIATVGPASNTPEMLTKLVKAGVNIFRLNFSHGSHEGHLQVIKHIREINSQLGTNVAILQDLQGPKIRTNMVKNNGVELIEGNKIVITMDEVEEGTAERIGTTYKAMINDVKIGDMILIDDGNIELKVAGKTAKDIECTVVYGGILKSKKGINLPNSKVSAPSLTEKDKEDLLFGLENDVDWVALSFVREAKDMRDIKAIISGMGKTTKVVAKIEKPEALANIDGILEESDGLMVARGDLGVEINMEDVPLAQKMMIKKCNMAGKPVIVATQMMESMISNPRPTRAEANDVANAVIDGADAVMLSAETASGSYPLQTIQSMSKIIRSVEDNVNIYNKDYDYDPSSPTFYNENVIEAACKLAHDTMAKAIVGISKSGFTAFKLSSHRPEAQILVFTEDKTLLAKLNLIWGVTAFSFDTFATTDEAISYINDKLKKEGYLKEGDTYVITGSMPMEQRDHTNMIKLQVVK